MDANRRLISKPRMKDRETPDLSNPQEAILPAGAEVPLPSAEPLPTEDGGVMRRPDSITSEDGAMGSNECPSPTSPGKTKRQVRFSTEVLSVVRCQSWTVFDSGEKKDDMDLAMRSSTKGAPKDPRPILVDRNPKLPKDASPSAMADSSGSGDASPSRAESKAAEATEGPSKAGAADNGPSSRTKSKDAGGQRLESKRKERKQSLTSSMTSFSGSMEEMSAADRETVRGRRRLGEAWRMRDGGLGDSRGKQPPQLKTVNCCSVQGLWDSIVADLSAHFQRAS